MNIVSYDIYFNSQPMNKFMLSFYKVIYLFWPKSCHDTYQMCSPENLFSLCLRDDYEKASGLNVQSGWNSLSSPFPLSILSFSYLNWIPFLHTWFREIMLHKGTAELQGNFWQVLWCKGIRRRWEKLKGKKSEAKNEEEEEYQWSQEEGLGDQFHPKIPETKRLEAFKRKANHGTQSKLENYRRECYMSTPQCQDIPSSEGMCKSTRLAWLKLRKNEKQGMCLSRIFHNANLFFSLVYRRLKLSQIIAGKIFGPGFERLLEKLTSCKWNIWNDCLGKINLKAGEVYSEDQREQRA